MFKKSQRPFILLLLSTTAFSQTKTFQFDWEKHLGKEKLASIIPYSGLTFFKLYSEAVNKAGTEKNLLSEEVTNFIKSLK